MLVYTMFHRIAYRFDIRQPDLAAIPAFNFKGAHHDMDNPDRHRLPLWL